MAVLAIARRTQSNEAAMEMVKLQEEIDLMKVQLDAARKEAEAQQKRCAAIEVCARIWVCGCVCTCVCMCVCELFLNGGHAFVACV